MNGCFCFYDPAFFNSIQISEIGGSCGSGIARLSLEGNEKFLLFDIYIYIVHSSKWEILFPIYSSFSGQGILNNWPHCSFLLNYLSSTNFNVDEVTRLWKYCLMQRKNRKPCKPGRIAKIDIRLVLFVNLIQIDSARRNCSSCHSQF